MNIPGFQIERPLGRFGDAGLYLASQIHPYRRVALAVARRGVVEAGEALRELEGHPALRADFRHPNILHALRVGAHGEWLYLAMEYVEGGDLRENLAWGIGLHRLIRAFCDLCDALDHAREKGLAHGRVSAANILFRSPSEVVLAGYCAAAFDPAGSSRPLPVGGAGPAQHRDDLFDLAQTLYQALTGETAHGAARSDANGQASASAVLPGHLKMLQPVLDQALAVDANRRFQTGAEFREALAAVARSGALANLSIKTAAVSSGEIRTVGEAAGLSSREPIGDERSAFWHSPQFSRRLLVAGLAVALIGGGVYAVERQSWRLVAVMAQLGLAEDPNVQSAWMAAEALRQDPAQSLAVLVAGYRQVLTLDATHSQATQAIAGLADQWRQGIIQALAQNDLGSAEAKLNEMTLAFPDDYSLVDLGRQISNRRAADTLLASTRSLLRSQGMSRIPAATVAIQAYQEIVRLAPGHPAALAELTALAEHYAELARQAAGQGDVDGAIVYLERAATADSGLPMLVAVREEIQRATRARSALQELLQQAGAQRAQGLLVHPPGNNAAELYHRVLATAPDNGIALQGLNEVTSQLLNKAARMFDSGDLSAVEQLLDQASAAGIEAAALLEIQTRLDQQTEALATISEKLTEAGRLLAEGFITEPQERNAVAVLRDVQRLDPGNAQAEELLGQAAARLAAVAQEAFAAGLPEPARHYLDLALTVTPDQVEWRSLRESWQ